MAITNQPADDSLYSAYAQIQVETDGLTPGLEIKTQDFSKPNMISLNIIDNEKTEVLDNSAGENQFWYRTFRIPRKMAAGEWYALRIESAKSNVTTLMTVELYQCNAESQGMIRVATTDLVIGPSMVWRVQVPPKVVISRSNTMLAIYAGKKGATAGVKITLTNMSLAYGQNFIYYRPSSVMAASSLTESTNIRRYLGFGTKIKYDLSFLAKAGFRADIQRSYPYIDLPIPFAIDYNLVSAYAYRGVGEQNFNVRYASRGVMLRGYIPQINLAQSRIGLVLTDRVPDRDRNLYVKKYYGYPYLVTLFPRGVPGLSNAIQVDVRAKFTEDHNETQFYISRRINIPLVREFNDELMGGVDYIKLAHSGGERPSEALNIIFINTEIPCNPFYIRWINRKGGWETYMFEQHKKYTQKVDRGDQYVLANPRDPGTSQTRGELAPEIRNIVQAGAEQLDENDFNLLKGIALSPLVQRYDYSIEKWQRVLVNDTELTWDTKTPRKTVSYEFQLIDEQTQW